MTDQQASLNASSIDSFLALSFQAFFDFSKSTELFV